MTTFYGLKLIDLVAIVGYFAVVMAVGFWASRRVKDEDDFFLGGRSFGKGLLVMHWLCTGTHSEQAVQVSGATARIGLGGIWYQWMYLFSTPFYWMIAPIIRRLRVTTTGDFFRIRYGRSLEVLYSFVALGYLILSIAMLLRGAGAAVSGATGGAIPTEESVLLLSVLFSTYIMAGGLMAAAYTDVVQGVMIIVLSFMLVPAGLNVIGGMTELHASLDPTMLSITAPEGAREGDLGFVIALSLLVLVGIVVQPHVMTATGSGKTELEARVGFCYGNFVKRLLTIAWAFTGLIAVVIFPEVLQGVSAGSPEAAHASETLFGRSIQLLLGDGWRGLMIACLLAGITSAETFMVTGSAIFTHNFYRHFVARRTDRHYLWVARFASAGLLATGLTVAFAAESLTQILVWSIQLVGLLGGAFWLGVTWRRANSTGVWASFGGALAVWLGSQLPPEQFALLPSLASLLSSFQQGGQAFQILLMLGVAFGLLIIVSLLTRPLPAKQLNGFFARLHTPVGRESDVRLTAPAGTAKAGADRRVQAVAPDASSELTSAAEGDDIQLDYQKASAFAYRSLQRLGLEIPRAGRIDWGGFLVAWGLVGAFIVLLMWLARLGA